MYKNTTPMKSKKEQIIPERPIAIIEKIKLIKDGQIMILFSCLFFKIIKTTLFINTITDIIFLLASSKTEFNSSP